MLNTIREYWKAVKESNVFVWLVIIFLVALYCNFGWAWGYVMSNPENVPHWIRFLMDPFLVTSVNVVYGFGAQLFFATVGPIFWVVDWILYGLFLCFGGIAKLLILP